MELPKMQNFRLNTCFRKPHENICHERSRIILCTMVHKFRVDTVHLVLYDMVAIALYFHRVLSISLGGKFKSFYNNQ